MEVWNLGILPLKGWSGVVAFGAPGYTNPGGGYSFRVSFFFGCFPKIGFISPQIIHF